MRSLFATSNMIKSLQAESSSLSYNEIIDDANMPNKDLIIIRDQPIVNRCFHYFYVFITLEDQYAQNRNHTRRQVST